MSTTVFTHANCTDGAFAAYIAVKTLRQVGLKNVSCFPVEHGKSYEVPTEGNIIFLDLCPPANIIQSILDNGQHVTILDHHNHNEKLIKSVQHPNATAVYDVNRCGAKLTYDHFADYVQIKKCEYLRTIVDYVDDRDRWTWAHPDSKEITESIYFMTGTLPHGCDSKTCDTVFNSIDNLLDTTTLDTLKIMGITLLAQSERHIDNLLKSAMLYWFTVGDKRYKVAMCETRLYRSEVGSELMKVHDIDFSVCWSYRLDTNEFWLSLRSINEKTDVSKVCLELGGGGQRNAGGCTVKNIQSMIQLYKAE